MAMTNPMGSPEPASRDPNTWAPLNDSLTQSGESSPNPLGCLEMLVPHSSRPTLALGFLPKTRQLAGPCRSPGAS